MSILDPQSDKDKREIREIILTDDPLIHEIVDNVSNFLCPLCMGRKGVIFIHEEVTNWVFCPICDGIGYINWIEIIKANIRINEEHKNWSLIKKENYEGICSYEFID